MMVDRSCSNQNKWTQTWKTDTFFDLGDIGGRMGNRLGMGVWILVETTGEYMGWTKGGYQEKREDPG